MTAIEKGQIWEMYSNRDDRWSRVVVADVKAGEVVLRYEGTLELVTTTNDEMIGNSEQFRPIVE